LDLDGKRVVVGKDESLCQNCTLDSLRKAVQLNMALARIRAWAAYGCWIALMVMATAVVGQLWAVVAYFAWTSLPICACWLIAKKAGR